MPDPRSRFSFATPVTKSPPSTGFKALVEAARKELTGPSPHKPGPKVKAASKERIRLSLMTPEIRERLLKGRKGTESPVSPGAKERMRQIREAIKAARDQRAATKGPKGDKAGVEADFRHVTKPSVKGGKSANARPAVAKEYRASAKSDRLKSRAEIKATRPRNPRKGAGTSPTQQGG